MLIYLFNIIIFKVGVNVHYHVTIPPWSHPIGPGFSKFSQQVGQLEGSDMGLFKSFTHEDESDKPYQSDLLTWDFEFKREG